MVNRHWIAAKVIWLILLVVYLIGALVMTAYLHDSCMPTIILSAFCYGLFMIITMGRLFAALPKSISKYYRNKTPDNPDGSDI